MTARSQPPTRTALVTELVGTFVFMFLGLGAIMTEARFGLVSRFGVSIVWGLVIAVLVIICVARSGAHFNAAVTIAVAALGFFPWRHVLPYVAMQLLGATAAALTLRALFGNVANIGATIPTVSTGEALLWEAGLTAVLLATIAVVVVHRLTVPQTAVAIGVWIALAGILAGPSSGASLNPTRSIGPAIASGHFSGLWIYLVAPIVGAVAGAWLTVRALRHPQPIGENA